ncbi:MAG: thermonuclease family protein [Cyclobacteriaceae bacterium]|nr:thermonuclease family protein [Cyclobacteriaceae bacterium]
MRIIFVAVLILLSPSITFGANELVGKVVSVIDGNTFELETENKELYKIILYGIDCPEMGQPFSEAAKAQLEKLILKQTLTVTVQGKNRYGIRQGYFVNKNRVDPRNILLKNGLAWTAEQNSIQDLEDLRLEAMVLKVGIWTEDEPVPPWIYRRTQSMLQPKSS